MDPKGKKEFAQIVEGVIDRSVKPELKKINEKLDEHTRKLDATMEMTAKNSEDIETIKIDIKEMKEDISDSKYTEERIETRLDAVFRRQDDISLKTSQLNRRVLRLESKKA